MPLYSETQRESKSHKYSITSCLFIRLYFTLLKDDVSFFLKEMDPTMILVIDVSFLWLGLELPTDIVHWDVYNDSFNREFWPYVLCVCAYLLPFILLFVKIEQLLVSNPKILFHRLISVWRTLNNEVLWITLGVQNCSHTSWWTVLKLVFQDSIRTCHLTKILCDEFALYYFRSYWWTYNFLDAFIKISHTVISQKISLICLL